MATSTGLSGLKSGANSLKTTTSTGMSAATTALMASAASVGPMVIAMSQAFLLKKMPPGIAKLITALLSISASVATIIAAFGEASAGATTASAASPAVIAKDVFVIITGATALSLGIANVVTGIEELTSDTNNNASGLIIAADIAKITAGTAAITAGAISLVAGIKTLINDSKGVKKL